MLRERRLRAQAHGRLRADPPALRGDRSLRGEGGRADWGRLRRLVEVNVLAPVQLTQRLVAQMVERGRGGVLNVGSGAGFSSIPGNATYVGSNHFLDGFTETLRAEVAAAGVVVTQVAPGPVESKFDEANGIAGGMPGSPPAFVRISAAQCAREALEGFERGEPLVFPGRAYGLMMRACPSSRARCNAARR